MWRKLLFRNAHRRSRWFLALGVSFWACSHRTVAADRSWLSWPPARAPRVAAAAGPEFSEVPGPDLQPQTAAEPVDPDPEEVLRQLEEAGVFEGQEEVLLQLRELAKQGVHPLDVLTRSSAAVEEEAQPPVLDSFDVQGIANYVREHKCKDVVVMCGAGLSTAAGIPDFRTPGTGLYDTLQRFNLTQPESIFELDFFRQEPGPFYELCRELWPGRYKPTLAHYFIKLLEDKGILRRCYTQNIDSLERQAGVSRQRIVAAHGNFDEAHVIDKVPEEEVDIEELRQAVFAGEAGWRTLAAQKGGLVKPKVVLFGESLPDRYWELNDADLEACDLLIVLGTSLVVEPFASLVGQTPSLTPRLLINREPSGTCDRLYKGFRFKLKGNGNWRDVWHEGACDQGCRALAEALGWEEELEVLMAGGPKAKPAPWARTRPDAVD